MTQDTVLKFVGTTGLPGSGKEEFAKFLEKFLAQYRIDLKFYSLSDELREEARRRGVPIERPTLQSIANELRFKFGNGIIATMLGRKIFREIEERSKTSSLVIIIDSIRTPDEVKVFRQMMGERFILVAMEAPIENLIERISARARFDEKEEVVKQREAAKNMILKETGLDGPPHGVRINDSISMADYHVDNSLDLEALGQAVEHFAKEIILEDLS